MLNYKFKKNLIRIIVVPLQGPCSGFEFMPDGDDF